MNMLPRLRRRSAQGFRLGLLAALLLALPTLAAADEPDADASGGPPPVERILLFSSGVGYF